MNEELIQRFFRKECTPEEASIVLEYLNGNRHVLDAYMDKSEWDDIQSGQSISGEFWDEVWQSIENRRKAHARVIRIRRFAAAACLIGIFFLGFLVIGVKKSEPNSSLSMEHTVAPHTNDQVIIIRTADQKERIVLPDSSIVELSKGATIKYAIPFRLKRDIELTGQANFKVAKDRTKPFTVFAGGLATTALGTEFGVTAIDGVNKILVKLFEGKVVVRSINNNSKGWNKDVYLSAGQQLKYDLETALVSVGKIRTTDGKLLAKSRNNISKEPGVDEGRDLIFNGTSLPDVLEQLARYFDTKISFNKEEISRKHFTGTISKTDSLAIILKVIAQMNDLQVASGDTGFVVEKIAPTKEDEEEQH
jgi:transmembrane sensor